MKTQIQKLVLALLFWNAMLAAYAQGTAFTYQGRLTENGAPANGINDLTFTLYTAPSGGAAVGTSNVFNDVAIAGGLFTVTLDFGASAFDGNARWLEIATRPGASAGAYTSLTPRQPLQATPYAIRAANFSGTVSAAQLPANIARLDANQAFSGSLQLTNPANVVSGNGLGLTNLNLESLGPTGTVRFANSGRFESPVVVTSSDAGSGGDISVADANYDGLPDFLLARGTIVPLAALTQPGARSFFGYALNDLFTGPARDYRGLMGGDLNGDGRTDLVAYDRNSRRLVSFLAGTTFPSFTEFSSLAFTPDLTEPTQGGSAMVLGDVNGDGRPDVVVAHPSSNVVFVVTNQVGTLFLSSTLVVGQGPRNVALGDINGDGRLDLVTANSGGNSVTVATNAGGGRFVIMSQLPCTNGAGLVLADFNQDNRLDIAASSAATLSEIKIWTNGGGGQMFSSFVLTGASYGTVALAAGDLNGDGAPDLLANQIFDPSFGNRGPVFYHGTRDGRFGSLESLFQNGSLGSTRVFATDLDQNGKADFSIANNFAHRVTTWLNQSKIDWDGIVAFDDQVTVGRRLIVEGETFLSGATHIAGIQGGLSVQGGITMADSEFRYSMTPGAKWGQDLYNGFGISYGLQVSSNGFYPNTFYFRTAPEFLNGAFAWYIGGYWRDVQPAFNPSSGVIGMTLDAAGLSVPRALTVGGAADFAGESRFRGTTRFESNIVFTSGSATFSNQIVFAAGPVVQPPAALSFGSSTRQMINLFDASYGIGVQNSRLYFRGGAGPSDGFAWFQSGAHSNTPDDPGAGGTTLMSLNRNRLTVNTSVGLGTATPGARLHLYSADNPATMRIQSSGGPGFGRIEFLSDPQGSPSEWRPAYIQSTDNGGFSGGLSFVVNGTGFDNRFGEVETMRVVNGRVGIGTPTPVSALQVIGTVTATAFNPPSDRNMKENFVRVSPREVLEKVAALPISGWNFIGDAATPHVGPMAQDFHAAFGLGTDERHIATVDADGVALAAIQGLNQKLEAEVKSKDARINELEKRLSAIETLLNK